MNNELVTTLIVLLVLSTILWVATFGVVLFMVWRMRKVVMGISLAIRGISQLGKQISNLSKNVGEAKDRFNKAN